MASDPAIETIRIPRLLWTRLVRELERRGKGKGESGAFLLGGQQGATACVTGYICYDDLDPHALQKGAIAFHANGYAALWQHCRDRRVQVLADVHTHPGWDVQQSGIDQRHPMLPVKGHTGMIVPKFGSAGRWSLRAVGVYEYLGNFAWRTHNLSESPPRVRLTLW